MPNVDLAPLSIRVVLAGMGRLAADAVRRGVLGEADIMIVGELGSTDDIQRVVDNDVHVIVTTRTDEGVPPFCHQLLFGLPFIPVIAICKDDRLEIFDRREHRQTGWEELVREIRSVGARVGVPLNR